MFKTPQIVLAILFFLSYSISQAQISKEFPKEVNLVKMTDPGVAIVGTDDALYALDKKGEILWNNAKLRKVEAERVQILSGSELIFVSDKGLLARNRVLNVFSGNEYANSGTKGENIFGARVIHGTNQLWVMPGPDKIDVWDIDNNQKMYSLETYTKFGISTNKMVSLTATFEGMQPLVYTGKKEAIAHLGLGHLARYDLLSGKMKWMFDFKPYKLKKPGEKGDRASNPSNGFSIMKVDPQENTLYFPFRDMLIAVDMESGQAKWEVKAHKIGQVRDMYVLDEGILVLTYRGLQLIDKQSGAEIWDKGLKIKGAEEGLLIKDEADFYAVSKNSVVKIDLKNKRTQTLTEKIKFQGGDSFSGFEVLGDVLTLSGAQNTVCIDKNSGRILKTVFYKKPGPGLVTIAQNMALATVAMASTLNSYKVNSQAGNRYYHQYTPRMMSMRNGSSASENALYISTKFKEKDANGFGVARVDKQSGETLKKIVIGEREAVYDVDEYEGLIFYKSGKKSVGIQSIR